MSINEFALIEQYFARHILKRGDVEIGIGDDCAIVIPPPNQRLAITTDTLVENTHFFSDIHPYDLGFKSVAVNLSDLAAMGAKPAWLTLALTLPHIKPDWLGTFSEGFFALANHYHTQLIGGDLTRGPLSVTVTAFGFLPVKKAMQRNQAQDGDLIYVTGQLGEAGLALKMLKAKQTSIPSSILMRLNRPEPKVSFGQALLDIAHACIDISDGLAQDLNHILKQSQKGAIIHVDALPIASLQNYVSADEAISLALTAGDDYELCFTIPAEQQSLLEEISKKHACPCTLIGRITSGTGLTLTLQNGSPYHANLSGFQHF